MRYVLWTATACLLGSLASTTVWADNAEAVAAIEKLGGTVRQIAKDTEQQEASFHLSGKELTDDGLSHLKQVSQLVWLNLANTKITDAGLAQLADIKSLTRLHLEKTSISDAGLTHLQGLENLEYLNLYGTKVGDAGLDHLKGLKKLKKLYLWQSQATAEGAAKLKESLPEIDINLGADLKKPVVETLLAKGEYVRVRLEGDMRILQLAEVQIFELGTGAELQQAGSARQSSTYDSAEAKRAVDGNADQDFSKSSVSHTNEQKSPWWLVDLGAEKEISKIVIKNRSDCCGDRLQGALIDVLDASLTVVWSGKIEDAKDASSHELVNPPSK